ncbi:glycoside hydrolase family 55 protein [Paenibacillus hemerocallicola]
MNVRWFGATGDGVTDDTAAIRSAVDVADTIWFPKPRVAYRMSLITMPRM